MSRRKKKYVPREKKPRGCESCSHCIPIGEGDHLCDEFNEIVLDEYCPSENYLMCNGRCWEE